MPSTLTDSERQQIHQAIAAAAAQTEGRPVPLESSLLHSTHHAEVPLWLALCREALLRNGFMPEAASERRAIAAQLAGVGEGVLMFDAVAGFQMPPASHHPLAPEEVAALALGLGDPGRPRPSSSCWSTGWKTTGRPPMPGPSRST